MQNFKYSLIYIHASGTNLWDSPVKCPLISTRNGVKYGVINYQESRAVNNEITWLYFFKEYIVVYSLICWFVCMQSHWAWCSGANNDYNIYHHHNNYYVRVLAVLHGARALIKASSSVEQEYSCIFPFDLNRNMNVIQGLLVVAPRGQNVWHVNFLRMQFLINMINLGRIGWETGV